MTDANRRRKHWRVEISYEWFVRDHGQICRLLDGYVGTVHVAADNFLRNSFTIGGEHDPTDLNAQDAVGRLVAAVREFQDIERWNANRKERK